MDLAGWVSDALGGSMALAVPVALLAGHRVLLLPVRGAAAAGLPLVHDRGRRRRGRRRPPARGGCSLGTSLFVLGLAVVFVVTGVAVGALGCCC